MDFSTVQSVWKDAPHPAHEDDALVRSVLARDRAIRRRIVLRDLAELTTAAGMAAGFAWVAAGAPVAWPWWAAAAITLGVGGVFVVERLRPAGGRPPSGTVRETLVAARAEVDHQIRLLRTVAWWYLTPLAAAVLFVVVGTALAARAQMDPATWARGRGLLIAASAIVMLVVAVAFGAVWWLNARAVRVSLLPHRAAIDEVIRHLDDEGQDGEGGAVGTQHSALTAPTNSTIARSAQ